MKRNIAIQLAIPVLGIALLFSACKKDDSTLRNTVTDPASQNTLKMSGVVKDDSLKVASLPLIVSTDFVNKNPQVATKKPVKGGGGSTTGGGTTTTTGDTTTVLPPTTTTLPGSVTLLTPPVQQQGGEGSCVAFAVGYGARSVEQYYKTGATAFSYSGNIFSPEFLYNQTKFSTSCGSGTGVTTALDFLKSTGICTWQSMPYSYDNGCSLLPTGSQSSEAANYRIAGYSTVISSDQTAIKTMLVNKHPVIFTCTLDDSFYNAQPGFVWRSFSNSTGVSHGMIICGYDDSKHAYKVMNSWGTGWADSGYTWIDYDFFPQTAFYYSYVMTL